MKCTNTTLLVAIVCSLQTTTSAQVSDATFQKPITITATAIRIDSLLNQLARQTGVEFSFSTTKLSPAQMLAVTQRQQSLSQWLSLMQQRLRIQHKVVGNHIILFESPKTASADRKEFRSIRQTPGTKTTTPPVRIQIDSSQQTPDTAAKRLSNQQPIPPAVSNRQVPTAGRTAASSAATTPSSTPFAQTVVGATGGAAAANGTPATGSASAARNTTATGNAAAAQSTAVTGNASAAGAATTAGNNAAAQSTPATGNASPAGAATAAGNAAAVQSTPATGNASAARTTTATGNNAATQSTPATGNASATRTTTHAGNTTATPSASPASRATSTSKAPTTRSQRPAATRERQDLDDDGEPGRELIRFLLGYSKHGSGDMDGIVFGGAYEKYVSHAFSLSVDLRGSINYQKHTIMVKNEQTGGTTDASVRFTTAGVQLGVLAQLSLVSSVHHEIRVGAGPFGRFQSASNGSDGYSGYSPQVTGQPVYLIGYDNKTPQNTCALGGLLQLQYQYTLRNKLVLGVAAGFQTDTNGDSIPQAGITIGKRI